jgi:hypothetical protein
MKNSISAPRGALNVRDVRRMMLDKLDGSGLDEKDAKVLSLEPFTGSEAKKLGNLPAYFAGFRIPYFDLEGRRTKFWRYRYLESTKVGFDALTTKKPLRYAQSGKSVNEIYLPPVAGTNWKMIAASSDIPVVITEGELKAACATRNGTPTIGLGGVWCFKSTSARFPLLPQFKEFAWKGRTVYICYDSDAVTNPQVMSAENALARELTMLGAEPMIVRIPQGPPNVKIGVDDYIVEEGINAFRELLDTGTEWRAASELFALNEEVVYVRDPGVILRMENLQHISPRAFTDHAYSTRIYHEAQESEKGTKLVERNAAKEWLKWPQRAEVARVTYKPGDGRITQKNELNVWPGWGIDAEPGDIAPWRDLLDYLFFGDKKARDWFEQWCAYPLQYPGTKMYSCVLIWGLRHGTGKSLIGYTLGKIYGANFTEIGDKNLHESHNEWAENRQFVMGDEITGGDKRGQADRMKSIITQQLLRLNPKYVPSYTVPDCINYYFTSNHPDSFFLEDDDRRNFIHEVKGPPRDREFYARYDAWLNGDGPSHLFHHLLSLSLKGFEPKAPAMVTEAKLEMIDSGRSDLGGWVALLRDSPDSVLRMDSIAIKHDLWRAEDLLALYDPLQTKRVTSNGMARELKRAGFKRPAGTTGIRTSRGQVRLWAVRNEEKYMRMNAVDIGKAYDTERAAKTPAKAKF